MKRIYRWLKIILILIFFSFFLIDITNSQNSFSRPERINFKIEKKVNQYIYIISSPNPFKSKIRFRIFGLSTINKEKFEFKIYNFLGFEIEDLSKLANDSNDGSYSDFFIELSNLNPGIYFALLSTEKYCNLYKFMKTE